MFTRSLSSQCSNLITMTFQLQTDRTVRPADGGIIRCPKEPSLFTDLTEMLPNKFVIYFKAFFKLSAVKITRFQISTSLITRNHQNAILNTSPGLGRHGEHSCRGRS